MVEPETASGWQPRAAWAGISGEGRFGAEAGAPGVTVKLRSELSLATVIARPDHVAALARHVEKQMELELPSGSSVTRSSDWTVVWAGPNRWLFLSDEEGRFGALFELLFTHAAISDQSDSRAVLSLSGPNIRQMLAKGFMLDLHDSAFPIGAAVLTSVAHVGVHAWRGEEGPDGPVFEIAVARSLAGSFWSWLSASAAEIGYRVGTDRD